MKITLISTLFFLTSSFSSNSQSNYYFGYQEGFKYGCQCLNFPPKNVAMYSGSYDQGYLDGKVDGLIFSKNSQKNSNQNTYSKPHDYNQPVYSPDIDFIASVLSQKQSRYNSNREKVDSYISTLKATIQAIRDKRDNYSVSIKFGELFILENELYKDINKIYKASLDYSSSNNTAWAIGLLDKHYEKLNVLINSIKSDYQNIVFRISQLQTIYNSFPSKNIAVKNGWHLVYSTNQKDFCEIRRVYVENNKIIHYIMESPAYVVWDKSKIEFSKEITNCKTTIKLTGNPDFTEIIFINVLANPNETASAPVSTGSLSFWTNYGKEEINIYVENQYVGTLDSFFNNGTPNCGQDGTVVYTNKPGTYNYIAVSNKYRWSGSFTITSNNCGNKKLIE